VRTVEDAEEQCKSTEEMKRYFVMLVLLITTISSNARFMVVLEKETYLAMVEDLKILSKRK